MRAEKQEMLRNFSELSGGLNLKDHIRNAKKPPALKVMNSANSI